MNKNVKSMFFVVTLLTLLVAVSAVSASDVSDDTPIADSLQDNVVSDVTQATADDSILTEQASVASSDNNVETTKNLEKEDKNVKTSTKTVDVNNYNELLNAINNAFVDDEHDEFIINLNTGTYVIESSTMLWK